MYGVQYGEQYSGVSGSAGEVFTKVLTDTINVASTIVKTAGKLLINTINASSVFIKSVAKRVSDSFIIATFSLETFKAMGLTLIDSLNVSSIYSRVLTIARTFTESINVTSALLKSIQRAFSDTLIMIDATIETAIQKVLTFIDSIVTSEVFVKGITRTLSDALNTSEVFSKFKTSFLAFVDSIIVTESLLKQRLLLLLDSIRASESFIIRVNGVLQNWCIKIRTAVDWTSKIRTAGSWTSKTRVTSLWTEKPRQE